MLAKFTDWLDRRTGHRKLVRVLLLEHIPGGARWRYVWGSCLLFVFAIQVITGLLLMTAYSPSDTTAWSSVYFIQYKMDFGWFIRGLHHFGSQMMVILLAVHVLQVVIAGAHLPPREINWWLGLGLLATVLGLSLTGYLLPWDQKGYWATQVATNIAGNLPKMGTEVKRFAVGGPAYGHHTLTRFFTLHVALLPALVVVLTVLHLTMFRRHGVTTSRNAKGEGWFWPEQAFRDMVAGMLIFAVMVGLVLWGHGHAVETPGTSADQKGLYESWAHAGQDGLGANLDAPADPDRADYPARPEWYFLFLFQFLKYFPGDQEVVGSVLVPMAVGLLLFLLPLLGYGRMRSFGHIVGILVIVGLLTGAGVLTCLAVAEDLEWPVARGLVNRVGLFVVPAIAVLLLLYVGTLSVLKPGQPRRWVFGLGGVLLVLLVGGSVGLVVGAVEDQIPVPVYHLVNARLTDREREIPDSVRKFNEKRRQADEDARRALTLAGQGIPVEGPRLLLRNDPRTQGPALFRKNCAVCHTHRDVPPQAGSAGEPSAPDLTDFGTEKWLVEFLHGPHGAKFLGRVKEKNGDPYFTTMGDWVKQQREKKGAALDKDFAVLAGWLARHPRKREEDAQGKPLTEGYRLFAKEYNCIRCHRFSPAKEQKKYKAPDLTGYGSADWLRMMLMAPGHPWRYGPENRMPAFRDLEGAAGEVARQEYAQAVGKLNEALAVPMVQLSPLERELIIRWLTGDDRVVFGGSPISGPAPPGPEGK